MIEEKMYDDETLRGMLVSENEWLSARTRNALRNAGFSNLYQVKGELDHLRYVQGIGKRALKEVNLAIHAPFENEMTRLVEWVEDNMDLMATIKKNVEAGMQIAFLLPKDMERGK
jgi:hypothetical protein